MHMANVGCCTHHSRTTYDCALLLVRLLTHCRSFADRVRRDEQVKERISQKLVESGEKERLKELLRQKLIECGWRDEMKQHCKGGTSLRASPHLHVAYRHIMALAD